jgi:glycosyltransferase involved in cell wall biosynthesis
MSARLKILMLAPQPFFEPRGTPFSVLGRLKALSKLGHQVDLLTYHLGQDVAVPNVVIHRTPCIKFIKTIKVGPGLTKLFLDILLFAKAIYLLKKYHYDLLHTHEEASFFGILLAKLFRIKHLYEMHSSLPQQLSNFQFTRFRPVIRFFEWLEFAAINSSNAVITICPALEEHVKKIDGCARSVMIENVSSADYLEIMTEEDVNECKAAYSLNGEKIVLYTGTFELYQGVSLLVSSAAQVLRERQDVVFLLVGGNLEQVRYYQNWVNRIGLSSHFYFTGTRPPEEIPGLVRISHVLVSPRISGTNTPLKIYPYLQSGKPIVATNIYSHTQVLNPNVAVLVDPNPEAFAQGILSVLGNLSLAVQLGRQARMLSEDRYNFQTFIQKTAQVLEMAVE